jgi:hypothetical protein
MDTLQVGGVGRDHRTVDGRVDGDDPADATPSPEHGYRACLGLMHLGKRYEPERMLAACQRAPQIGSTGKSAAEARPAQPT